MAGSSWKSGLPSISYVTRYSNAAKVSSRASANSSSLAVIVPPWRL
jgi:hypothetical protein